MKKWIAMFLALFLLAGLFAGCRKTPAEPDTQPLSSAEPEPTEPPAPQEDPQWQGLRADCFTGYMTDFEGEVEGVSFTGVRMKTDAYQPKAFVTKEAMKALRQYAMENGFDGLRVHVYVNQSNNDFLVGEQYAHNGEWTVIELSLADFLTTTPFWSQSEGDTDNYLWFEFIKLPVINQTCFTGAVFAYSGTVGGRSFDGFVFRSADYQPWAYFKDFALKDIQDYAKKNGFNALRIHAYPIQKDNGFIIGGQHYPLNQWTSKDFRIADLNEDMAFWSQSQGLTENYIYFEFVNSDHAIKPTAPGAASSEGGFVNTNPYFTADKNFAATDFTGAKGGNEFAGILLRSADYQPHFYFTQKAVDEIRAASETTGKNFLRIRVYAIQKNNGFMVGNTWVPLEQWTTVDVPISMVSTELQLWSQSEGTTEVYLWFDMYRLDIPEKLGPIDASFFEGVDCNIGAADFQGEVDGITLNGVQFKTVDYQPYFKFTAAGLEKIKAYAAENGYNFLNIHSYALLYNNGFIVGQTHTEPSAWNTTQVKIDELDESFRFWSQSEGATEIYLWFTWEKLDIPEATSPITAAFFEGIGCNITTRDFMGTVGEATINGVQIKSGDYQPYFRFTQAGLETIRSYAAQNGFDLLRIHSYAIQYNNGFIIGEKWTGLEQWNVTDVELSNLTVDFRFWSQSEGATEVYLWFEFGKAPAKPLLPASYFTGAFTFENFEGEAGGEQILAVKATSANYQPHFSFTEDAIAAIKAYAEENGFDTLTLHAYAVLTNNSFVLNNQAWVGAEWKTLTVNLSELTAGFDFWSQSEGMSEVYLWAEYGKAPATPLVPASYFTGDFTFENFEGEVDGEQILGVKATSANYQPHFSFTEDAVAAIKAYAAKNYYDTMKIRTYALLTNNGFVVGGTWTVPGAWSTTEAAIADLTADYDFWSQSEGTSEVYLTFEFYRAAPISDDVIGENSVYSILLPQNASAELQNAANELNLFLKEITGRTLPVSQEDGKAEPAERSISLGKTSLFLGSGLSTDGLADEASAIRTEGETIFLYGGSDVGTTYAVYELLEHWFGLKFYTPDCYTYTAQDTVAFEALELTAAPAVAHRTVGSYLTWCASWTSLRRMRVSDAEEYMNTLGHSLYQLMPPSSYYAAHPDWYSGYQESMGNENWQLCLSNSEMRAQLLANVKAALANNGDCRYFAIAQNDGDGFCTCESCKALNLKYSDNAALYSGAFLEMVNEIAEACAEEYPNVTFYMLAYTNRTDAPPTKGNLRAAANVGVMYAPIDGNRTVSYFGNSGEETTNNGRASKLLAGWAEICDHRMLWAYNAQFGDAMVPVNFYDSLAQNAAGYRDGKFEVVFEQAQGTVLSNFETLKNYLTAKALYDGSIDTAAETEAFLKAYYGPAANAMSQYWQSFLSNLRSFEAKGDSYRSWAAAQYLNGPYRYSPAIIAENYSMSYADACKTSFDAAYAALAEAYAEDSAQYAVYKKRIDLEYLSVLYLYAELYADQFTQEQGAQMVQTIEAIIADHAITVIPAEKIDGWRSAFGVVPGRVDFTFFENIGADALCSFVPYRGEIGGQSIKGVHVSSSAYQPSFKFTAAAIANIKAYAEGNGFDTLRIHAYANLTNNSFVLGGSTYIGAEWKTTDVDIDTLTESYSFWSQSEGRTDIYMTFEYVKLGVVNSGSFTGDGFLFEGYAGEIGGEQIEGVRAVSSAYQPSFTFTDSAVSAIKAYAEKNGFDTLTIHTYALLTNNGFVVNGKWTVPGTWNAAQVPIADLTSAFTFWSQSEGTSEVYLWCEFSKAPVVPTVPASSFTGGFTFENFEGEVGGEQIVAVKATSANYQPHFYFTEEGLAALKAYAAANGFDTLTFHAYANVSNNSFVLNNQKWVVAEWATLEVKIADLTTAFDFWSASEGTTEVYLWCEFSKAPIVPTVPASSFTGGFAFENFEGEVGGEQIVAVKATSANYQPHFYFTEEGLAALKAYAAANGFDTLTFHAYANVSNNSFVLNNQKWVVAEWATLEVKIADLTTAFDFWSASEGTTEVYLWCEFGKAPVQPLLSASFFTGSLTFEDFTGTVGGETFTGIKATGASYQPHFYFTEDAISAIKAFAAENHYDTLTIHAYANLTNNCLVLNNQCWVVAEWNKLTVSIADLTTAFDFWSQSEGTTELHLRFEYGQSAVQSLSAANAMLGGTFLMEL